MGTDICVLRTPFMLRDACQHILSPIAPTLKAVFEFSTSSLAFILARRRHFIRSGPPRTMGFATRSLGKGGPQVTAIGYGMMGLYKLTAIFHES